MRMRFAPQSFVEAAVTLAAAALMTIAGFEMLHGVAVQRAEELAAPAHPTDVATPQMEKPAREATAMPHVDEFRA